MTHGHLAFASISCGEVTDVILAAKWRNGCRKIGPSSVGQEILKEVTVRVRVCVFLWLYICYRCFMHNLITESGTLNVRELGVGFEIGVALCLD